VAATANRPVHRTHRQQDQPYDQQNPADNPQDVDCRDYGDYQQDDSENDQCASAPCYCMDTRSLTGIDAL
jgi:hypothetical protein